MENMEVIVNLLHTDWSTVDWDQFTKINDFQWTYGKTPFSHFSIPFFGSILYLVSIFSLQAFMKDRKPLTLKAFTLVHNIILTLLSLSMFLGVSYGAILKYNKQGFWAGLVCEQEANPIRGPMFFWSYIFFLSKFYEFIDSYLLVLKKKPLIFLHVWHHFVMPYVCWAGLEGKWCMALWTSAFWNSFVHIFMYFYYSASTVGYQPWWRKHLTALQIYQFVSGVLYTGIYFNYYFKDASLTWVPSQYVSFSVPHLEYTKGCTGEMWAIIGMFFVNCSFLVLFANFFVAQYIDKARTRREDRGNNQKRDSKPRPKKDN